MKMKTISIIISSWLILFVCSSCTEEITHGRTTFQDIIVRAYEFKDGKQYVFSPRTPVGLLIIDFDENAPYSYDQIMFRGWVDAKIGKLKDEQIRKDVTNYLYNKYPDLIDNVEVYFVQENFESIKIYSDKDFNGVKAGESLNKFFEVESRLVQFQKGKYSLFDGNILKNNSYKDTFIPATIDIRLKTKPINAGIYNFYIETKIGEGNKFNSKIITVNIK